MIERVLPPDDVEIELLGHVLLLGCHESGLDVLPRVPGLVTPDDFSMGARGELWGAIEATIEATGTADPSLVRDALPERSQAREVLEQVAAAMGWPHGYSDELTVRGCALAVRRDAVRREARRVADAFAHEARNGADPGVLLQQTATACEELGQRLVGAGDAVTTNEDIGDVYRRMLEAPETGATLRTGILDLDDVIQIGDGQLWVIAARPGLGKSSLARQIVWASALDGVPSLLVSLEMRAQEVLSVMLCQIAGVDSQRVARAALDPELESRFADALSQVYDTPLRVLDRGSLRIEQLVALARASVAQHGTRALVVDYLQLIQAGGDHRQEQVAAVSRALKALALDIGIPVVACAQLNRASDGAHKRRRPILSDLRESGAIEQDADGVVMLYRADPDQPVVEALVRKNRSGPLGTVNLHWDAPTTTFTGLSPEYEYESLPDAAPVGRPAKATVDDLVAALGQGPLNVAQLVDALGVSKRTVFALAKEAADAGLLRVEQQRGHPNLYHRRTT